MDKQEEKKRRNRETGSRRFIKVRREGGSPVITIGNCIPDDWTLISRDVVERTDKTVTIKFTRVS